MEAFPVFYRKHYRLILTVAQQRLGGVVDAEDVTAEVFRIAWAHHESGAPLSLPWVYTVLRNVIGNEYRRLGRLGAFVDAAGPVLVGEDGFGDRSDEVIDMRRAIMQLPDAERELLYMAYWEDLTRAEIAAVLGISAVAVRIRLMRARERLRQAISRDIGTDREGAVLDGRS